MKTITVKISNQGIRYGSGTIPWTDTNLPAGSFRFREREEVFWELAMTAYDKASGRLVVRVLDYEAEPEGFKAERKMNSPVRQLWLAPLEEAPLKAQLAYYQAGPLARLLATPIASATSRGPAAAAPKAEDWEVPSSTRSVSFSVPLLELTFVNGGVKGSVQLPGLTDPADFSIPNDHVVAEFNTIKPFFVKALKRKTISVTAEVLFTNDEPELRSARSPQIDRIDDNMLEVFRARGVRQLLTPDRITTVDKSLFTPEDVFESLDDNELGKAILPQDGLDLLNEILRHKKVRNARQLEFLAGRLHRQDRKLRFVLSPKFGFVFVAEGQEGRHFILELLDSNATYVWSLPLEWRTLDEQFRAVEKEIAAVASIGRGQYRRTLHFEHEFWFVIHESADSALVGGFPRWKNRLLEGLG
ncbi:hypothetical protein [Neolewinella agarilytica]|uniref:Uncharacterized protein n=1 Tax=Neolewinella agarilytica TaxID=478744 RepID=A0A1H9K4G0_9BACT|nr:hypothetical protein [Neolewinella agarilytica]SEQ93969.1 hypothetical protein SAMN05444359_11984 [Neolewinella agarilytica]